MITEITNHEEQALNRLILQYRGEGPVVPDPPPTDLKFLGVGHSYVKGTHSGLGVIDNSYRREMYYRWRTKYTMDYIFTGSFIGGDIPTPYHNGVAGEDSAGLDSLINGYLATAYPTPTTSDCVLMGPIEFADVLNSVPLATFRANIDSIINKIDAHSPLIKIFVVTGPDTPNYAFPPGQDLNDYAAEVRAAYTAALAAGKNVYLLDVNTQAIHIPGPGDPAGGDNIHPDWLGYEQMGEYMTDQIASLLSIPEVDTVVYMQSDFTAPDGTLIKTYSPEINATGGAWLDPNDRFDILSNYARGIGGYAFDTLFDINRVVWNGEIKMYQSGTANTFFIFKSNALGTVRQYFFMNQAAGLLYVYNEGGVWASAPYTTSVSTWYTFKLNIRGNSIEIRDAADVLILKTPLLSYGNLTNIGMTYFPVSDSRFDDLIVNR